MRSVIIDDEVPALDELSFLLKKNNVEVTGIFTDPFIGLDFVVESKPDAVFLDVDMPNYSGLELGANLSRNCPKISLVYVTAYPQYSFDAFKAYPIDYILKPIDEIRLAETIDRIKNGIIETNLNPSKLPYIRCFGKFELLVDENEVKFATNTAKELFAYLLVYHHELIYKDELISLLFDSDDTRKNYNNLRVSLHRLRTTLLSENIKKQHILIKNDFSLLIGDGVCDLIDFANFIEKNKTIDRDNIKEAVRLINSIKGELMSDIDTPWISEAREFWNVQVEKMLLKTAIYYQGTDKKPTNAERILVKLLELDPESEAAYDMLLSLYVKTDNFEKFIYFYKRYQKMLDEELSCKPDKKFKDFFEKIR